MEQTDKKRRSVAYFSMEIGIDERICTYSGGLGVLAGDTIRSAADLRVPMVAATLLYRKGYFRQRLEADGWQREEPSSWALDELLQEMPHAYPGHSGRADRSASGLAATMSRAWAASRSRSIFWTRTFTRTRSGTGG